MGFRLSDSRGTRIEDQKFTWRDMVQQPISKLDDDAFTRVRVILMNGIEQESNRFQHAAARMNKDLQVPLAIIRRSEQHQQTLVNWLISPDHSPLETTLGYEQTAIEVTAAIAQQEPEPYLAQTYRFGLLEDFDHLYRYSALYDRVEGKDANNLLQSYTDILPGRPTKMEHRHPMDDVREPYDRVTAAPLTKMNALTIVSAENQVRDYYMNIGPTFADPVARELYAEIASIEEQHTTQYESIMDPSETWMEKWLLHEANEVYAYYSCVETETNARIRSLWERFLDYELGHLHFVMNLFKQIENRDPMELLPPELPQPIAFQSQRAFVRQTLANEITLRARGTEYVPMEQEGPESKQRREQLNSTGSPSEMIAAGYRWAPGTELAGKVA